jgi:WD40 repeat protein
LNQVLLTSTLSPPAVHSLSLSPDGKYLTGLANDHFYLWNTSSWSYVASLGKDIWSTFITPDSKSLLTGEVDKINLRQFPNLTVVKTINTGSGTIRSLAIIPNSEVVAAIDDRGRLKLLDLNEGTFLQLLDSIPNNTGSFVLSPDGKTLVVCSDRFLKVWDLTLYTLQVKLDGNFNGPIFNNDGTILSVNILYPPNGRVAINYRTSDWTRLYSLNMGVVGNAFSPDDSVQIAFAEDSQIKMFLLTDGSIIRTINSEGKSISFISFFPDGETFFTISSDGEVKIRSTTVLIGGWWGSF